MSKIFILVVGVLLSFGISSAGTLYFNGPAGAVGPGGFTPEEPAGVPRGITFSFTGIVDAGGNPVTATYGYNVGVGLFDGLEDPVLYGPVAGTCGGSPCTGTLTIDFSIQTSFLQFAVGLGVGGPVTQGFTVALSNQGTPVFSGSVDTDSIAVFSEGQFTHSGSAIDKAVVTFSPSGNFFALDNLTFDEGASMPEPGMFYLMGSGLLLVGMVRRIRAHRKGVVG